jgi:hypothetical protein
MAVQITIVMSPKTGLNNIRIANNKTIRPPSIIHHDSPVILRNRNIEFPLKRKYIPTMTRNISTLAAR